MTIKPWRERVGFHVHYRFLYPTAVERAMEQEIQELRAELEAAQAREASAAVGSDLQLTATSSKGADQAGPEKGH